MGHFEEAEQYNQQARELKESLPESVRRNTIVYTLLNSADIQLKQQNYEEAQRLLLEILQSDADDGYRPLQYLDSHAAAVDPDPDPDTDAKAGAAAPLEI